MSKSKKQPNIPKQNLRKIALTIGAVALIAGSVPVAKRIVYPGELVTEIIDGDSFKIKNKQTVRYPVWVI